MERDVKKSLSYAVQAFTKAQLEAQQKGLSTFQYDKQVFDAKNPKRAQDKFRYYYIARSFFQKNYEFEGKNFSTESGFSGLEQIKAYGNINEEVMQAKDPQSAVTVHLVAASSVALQADNTKITDEESRNQLLANKLTKYYAILKESGNPGIYMTRTKLLDIISFFSKTTTGYFSPNLLFSGGDICLKDLSEDTFLAEVSHAFRNKNNRIGEAGQFIKDGLKDILTGKGLGFTPSAQLDNYDDTGKMEFDAHSIVQPALKDFLEDKTKTMPGVHYEIDKQRQKQGYSVAPALGVRSKILQGKIDCIKQIIEQKGSSKELETLLNAAKKQKENYDKKRARPRQIDRSHGGGGSH